MNAKLNSVELGRNDVVWDSPSENSGGAMPVGGHSVGAAVWVEDGSIRIYLDRSGSFDENNLMLKLGRFVVELEPNPFASAGAKFEQRLNLHSGAVEISAESASGPSALVKVWCSAANPTLYVSIEASQPVAVRAAMQAKMLCNPDTRSRVGAAEAQMRAVRAA